MYLILKVKENIKHRLNIIVCLFDREIVAKGNDTNNSYINWFHFFFFSLRQVYSFFFCNSIYFLPLPCLVWFSLIVYEIAFMSVVKNIFFLPRFFSLIKFFLHVFRMWCICGGACVYLFTQRTYYLYE